MAQLDNDIAVESLAPTVLEQVVELSILLTGEVFSDSLDDPDSLQFQTLSGHLAEKVGLCLHLPLPVSLYLRSLWSVMDVLLALTAPAVTTAGVYHKVLGHSC